MTQIDKAAIQKPVLAFQDGLLGLVVKHYWLMFFFFAITVLYVVIAFATPASSPIFYRYQLDPNHNPTIMLVLYLPYIFIWFISLASYFSLKNYVRSIRSSNDGSAFAEIQHGIFCLVFGMPLSAVMVVFTRYISVRGPALTPLIVQTTTYVNLVLLFAAFWFVYAGSRQLLRVIGISAPLPLTAQFTYLAFVVFYTFLIFHDGGQLMPPSARAETTYYLPDQIILTTIIIPRIISWFIGLQAAYNIYLYRRHVKGKIYREALTMLAAGLAGVVVFTALLRCFQAVETDLDDLSALVLASAYVTLLVVGVGFIMIAKGAERMHQLEKS